MTPEPRPARANWGGVVIAVSGAAEVLGIVGHALDDALPQFVAVPLEWLGATAYIDPLALIVAFIPLTFGTRRLSGIVGRLGGSRAIVFTAVVLAAVVEYVTNPFTTYSLGYNLDDFEGVSNIALLLNVFAVLVGIVAGFAIVRAKVLSGLTRWAFLVAAVLIGLTVVLLYEGVSIGPIEVSDVGAVPRAVALLLLGISYWRVGIGSQVETERTVGPPVTATAKSLAE